MAVIKASKVRRGLEKKGFVLVDGDHYYYHYLSDDGKKTNVWTKVSHGATDIGIPLIKMMAKQTKLSANEFIDLVNCPLSKDKYRLILEEKGFI